MWRIFFEILLVTRDIVIDLNNAMSIRVILATSHGACPNTI